MQTGGHCPLRLGPDLAAANPSGAQGLLGPAQPCVCGFRGVYPPVAMGDPDSTLGTLCNVLTLTPEHLGSAGLGGAWEDKAAFGCRRRVGRMRQLVGQPEKPGSQP